METGVEVLPLQTEPTENDLELELDGIAIISSLTMEGEDKQQWGEASHLLFQPGYLHVLKQMALSGQLQMYNIRSIAWRLFLGCLPEERDKWEESAMASREAYNALRKKHITDPHIASASLDVAVNNPLSQADDSPWRQFFIDNEMRQMINQDVVRTFPDVAFFKQAHIQESMLDILFIYSKEKPDLAYRQGMHEILAPIMFVLHAEERDPDDSSLAPVVRSVMDSQYLEHDAYTIFRELMENMEQWYMGYTLEADYYRNQSATSHMRKMKHDPRTNKPFEQKDITGNSAIGRKLEKIHHVFLKRADNVLYNHFLALSIPAQTYGIRWIRLLFGREFPLPSVLEMWDAIFADGPSLSLVDYICVAMLMHIREVLIEGDYAVCMQHLMRFPAVYEVNYLIQRALHLRNPVMHPSPRIWSYHPSRVSRVQPPSSSAINSLLDENFSTGTGAAPTSSASGVGGVVSGRSKTNSSTEKIADFLHTRLSSKNSSSSIGRRVTGSRSPSPGSSRRSKHHTDDSLTDEQLFAGMNSVTDGNSGSSSRKGRFKIIGKTSKGGAVAGKEMTSNPKPHSGAVGLNEMQRLSTQLEDLEAKCLYCGGKMDSMIGVLQEEVPSIPQLDQDMENTLLLTIAGLKQIRDLLLKKIPFSGDSTLGWETNTRNFNSEGMTKAQSKEGLSGHTPPAEESPKAVAIVASDNSKCSEELEVSGKEEEAPPSESKTSVEPREGSDKSSNSSMGDDWVNLSNTTHPLVASNN